MDLHQPFEYLAGSFCVPKAATFPPCLTVKCFPLCLAIFAEFGFTGFSARSPRNLPVFVLAERLTLLAHSVLVLALSYTCLMTILCHRSLLRIGIRVVILILQHRCTWCRLLLITHLDAPRVGAVIRVMLDVAAAEVRFQPEPAPAVCSQRTRSDDAVDPWVGSGFSLLLKK